MSNENIRISNGNPTDNKGLCYSSSRMSNGNPTDNIGL